jgi:hypothetical protein
MTALIQLANKEISKLYIAYTPQWPKCRSTAQPATGSMTFVNRFHSALERSRHRHVIFADGMWGRKDGKRPYFLSPVTIVTGSNAYSVMPQDRRYRCLS